MRVPFHKIPCKNASWLPRSSPAVVRSTTRWSTVYHQPSSNHYFSSLPFQLQRSLRSKTLTTRIRRTPPVQCRRSNKRCFSNPTTESTANSKEMEAVQERLKQVVQDSSLLETFSKELSETQQQRLVQLTPQSQTASATAAAATTVPEPSMRDLKWVVINTSIPFVGFGFMDNAILIVAGDAIDHSLGIWLGISTMCAAAIGNIVSDVAGVGLGTIIEDWCAQYLRLPVPRISTAQRQLRSVRFANQLGCAIGLVIGCVIGMFPLLFLDSNRVQARKREVALDRLFQDVINEAADLIGAQRTRLYIVCQKPKKEESKKDQSILPTADGDSLYAKYTQQVGGRPKILNKAATTNEDETWIPLGRGIVSRAVLTSEVWNIEDVHREPDFDVSDTSRDFETRNMLCVPVLDGRGSTIAVLQALNKIDGPSGTFTDGDIQILQALASHVSVSLQRLYYEASEAEDEEHSLKDTIHILKGSGFVRSTKGGHEVDSNPSRLRGVSPRRPLFPED